MITSGSAQQEAFWAALVDGDSHVLLDARAGCGKSSSCLEGLRRVIDRAPQARWRYAAFNKAIAEEFRPRAPRSVEVSTLHSFGFGAIRKAFGKVQVCADKSATILDGVAPRLRETHRGLRPKVLKAVSLAKNILVEVDDFDALLSLAIEHECEPDADDRAKFFSLTTRVLAESRDMSSIVDFDDMIWMPVVLRLAFPPVDGVIVDEAQDMNPVQHRLLARMAASGRVVVVGDPYQSIYAFRGADPDSIPFLTSTLGKSDRGIEQYPLTVSWRCPTSHVKLAQRYVPDFQAAPNAKGGRIDDGIEWKEMLAQVEPGDMVLCRANAPLVKACLALLAAGRPAVIRGRDVAAGVVALVEKHAKTGDLAAVVKAVQTWRDNEVARLSDRDASASRIEAVVDRVDVVVTLADECATIGELVDRVDRLFGASAPANAVSLNTVHRAKGLECERVWWVDGGMPRTRTPQQEQQERNIRYVATTRSRDRLAIVFPPEKKGVVANG